MINISDLNQYASKSKMDRFTVLREYLQIVFLNTFFRLSKGSSIVFKGGTSLRLMYGSLRYSEDLDFNTTLEKGDLQKLLEQTLIESGKYLPGLSYKELKTIKGYSGKIHFVSEVAPMPLTVKLDFSMREKTIEKYESTISTEFPIKTHSLVVTMTEAEILAEKIRTVFQREKGRDIYDIWFLLNKKTPLNSRLVNTKFKLINKKFSLDEVRKHILGFNKNVLEKDLFKFLPFDQRTIVKNLPEIVADKLKRAG